MTLHPIWCLSDSIRPDNWLADDAPPDSALTDGPPPDKGYSDDLSFTVFNVEREFSQVPLHHQIRRALPQFAGI